MNPGCDCGSGAEVGGGGLSTSRSPDWASAASSTIRSDLLYTRDGVHVHNDHHRLGNLSYIRNHHNVNFVT